MKHFLRALGFFRPDAGRIAIVLALLLVSVGANVLKPWPLALIVDSVLGDKPLPDWAANTLGLLAPSEKLVVLVAAMLLLHAGQGGLAAFSNYQAIGIGLRGLRRVRDEMFNWLQRLSLRFHQGASAGDLIYRASWDTYAFQTLFQQGLITCFTASASLLLMLGIMARVNGVLTLAALALVPVLVLVIKSFARRMGERGAAAQAADSAVTSRVQQALATLPLVQSYTREEQEAATFGRHTERAQASRLSQHGWEVAYGFAIAIVFGAGVAALTGLGAAQVLAGQLTVGRLLIFLAYLAQLYEPLNQLTHLGSTLAGAGASIRRVFEILDTPEEVSEATNAISVIRNDASDASGPADQGLPPLRVSGAIEFDRVSFGYQKEREILSDVTFKLAARESAALIGPSGVGKSTLMNLIPRFFDPTAGAVKLDGADLRGLKLKDLRSQIAVVLQEPILLPATIAENIAYGKPEAAREDIEAAARAANADGFIRRLPQGYETPVGEAGARLSVGERQRLNLARAFLKDAPILLLDEPTSALDAESETLVVASLRELMKGRTVLMAAHRLSTIQRVNRVIVLEEGRISETGAPDELLKRGGYYARVARGQVALE
jgi:ATP-binding cassette subfamily B protein/subfamily B ATP-binding cassette protein MsbA